MAYDIFKPEDFKVGTNYVLEASAGTGKTYNIVEIVKKLVGSGVKPEKLLIVTYTEKAAGELKDRIRKAIPNGNVDLAFIGTIHSFCKNTLEQFCVAAEKPSELVLIDENECKKFVKQFIRTEKILAEITAYKKVMPEEKLEGKLEKYFCAAVNSYYMNASFAEDPSIVVFSSDLNINETLWDEYIVKKKRIDTIYPGIWDDIRILSGSKKDRMRELASLLPDIVKNENTVAFNANTYQSVKGNEMTDEERDAYARLKKIKDDISALGDKGTIAVYKIAAGYLKDLYQKWQGEKEKRGEQTFNDMLRSVRENVVNDGLLLERLKEYYEYAIIDEFQDTNQKQWDIFRKVFLLKGAEPDPDHHIIVVGDPKQSIYSFQGADLYVYQKAKEEIHSHGGEIKVLGTNYRATKSIIKSTGEFFNTDDVKSHQGFTDFLPSDCSDKKFNVHYDGNDVSAFWIFGSGSSEKDLYAESVCREIVDCCSYRDGKTRLTVFDEDGAERNVTFGDFVILARTRMEMEPFVKALEKCGIPYLHYKDARLFTGIECAHWTALLDAVDTPDFSGKNREKFKKALFTCFFGLSLSEIHSEKYNKDGISEIAVFSRWKALAAEEKWEELIDSVLTDTNVEMKLGSLKDLKSLGVIRQIGDICVDYLSSGHTLSSLVEYLRKRMDGISDEETAKDDSLIAKGTDFDCVKIMTIHASKGLEFPVVVSAAGINDTKKSSDVYGYHAGTDDQYMISFIKPGGIYDDEQINEQYRLIYVDYTRAKYILVLPGCQLTTPPKNSKKLNIRQCIERDIRVFAEKKMHRDLDIASADFKAVGEQVKEILDKNRMATVSSLTEKEQKDVLKKLKDKKFWRSAYKHAYSSLSHEKKKKEILSEDGVLQDNGEEKEKVNLSRFDENGVVIVPCSYDATKDPQQMPDGYPAGTGLGNALHEIFEKIDYVEAAKDIATVSDDIVRGCYKAQGLRSRKDPDLAPWIGAAKEMITNVTGAVLPVIHGSVATGDAMKLGEIPLSNRKNETEFNYKKPNKKPEDGTAEKTVLHHYFNGFIDLLFRRGKYYSVLDWKSDRLSDDFTSYSDPVSVKEHVDSLYAIQRVLYSYTLIKWLQQFCGGTEQEIFEKHFGGVYYVFLRGCNEGTGNGIYAQTWENWDALKAAYDKIVSEKVGG